MPCHMYRKRVVYLAGFLSFLANVSVFIFIAVWRFDGERRLHEIGEQDAEILVETTPEALASLITAGPEESRTLVDRLNIEGEVVRVENFAAKFGVVATHPGN